MSGALKSAMLLPNKPFLPAAVNSCTVISTSPCSLSLLERLNILAHRLAHRDSLNRCKYWGSEKYSEPSCRPPRSSHAFLSAHSPLQDSIHQPSRPEGLEDPLVLDHLLYT